MGKYTLDEMMKRAKTKKFSLPHNVKSSKQLMPNGTWSYMFRHDELGELGRILILPHGAESQIVCEVVGESDDPMTTKRRAILEPITKGVANTMAFACGKGTNNEPTSYIPQRKERGIVKSNVYPCDVCGAVTSMLIFAPDAETKDRLEDYARMMYAKIKELNVPTWIVGMETEFIVSGKDLRKSLVLKVHPNRQEAQIMTPDEVMDKVDKLMEMHCKKFFDKNRGR